MTGTRRVQERNKECTRVGITPSLVSHVMYQTNKLHLAVNKRSDNYFKYYYQPIITYLHANIFILKCQYL